MRYRLRTLLIVSAIGLVPLTGCKTSGPPNLIPSEAAAALDSSPTFELLSLEPKESQGNGDGYFHGWKVLGKTTVEDRARIVTALRKGVPKYDSGVRAACFWPRHGIRVSHEGTTYDFVICFECLAAGVYADGNEAGGFVVQSSPQPAFDAELSQGGVPLAKK